MQLPGCSGSFISPDGLLVTNHHCVVSSLQEHSTPQANLGKDGYLARTRAEEKASKTYRVQVPRAFRDVTKEVLAAVPAEGIEAMKERTLLGRLCQPEEMAASVIGLADSRVSGYTTGQILQANGGVYLA